MSKPTTEQAAKELSFREALLPPKLRELRQKLSQKAKQQKRFRFSSLYDHVCRADTLQAAWDAVRRNGGAPGVDGVSIEQIAATPESESAFLAQLQRSVSSARWAGPMGQGQAGRLAGAATQPRENARAELAATRPEPGFSGLHLSVTLQLLWAATILEAQSFPQSTTRQRAVLREKLGRHRGPVPLPELITEPNRHLRGWAKYLSLGQPRQALRDINLYVLRRLAWHLRRRSQRGWKVPHDETAYACFARLGLLPL